MQVLRTKIRKFIAEQFEQTPSQDFAKSLLSDVYYLKDFNLQSNSSDGDYDYWIYYFDTHGKSYKIICAITRDRTIDEWSLKSEIYWAEFDKRKTPLAGMDYSIEIDNVKGYNEFIKEANRKLRNNPLVDVSAYHDDYDFAMTKEIVREFISLIVNYPKIQSLDNSTKYDELKQIYNDIIDLSVEDVVEYIETNYSSSGDKQDLIYQLNSMDSLDNNISAQKMNISPKEQSIR